MKFSQLLADVVTVSGGGALDPEVKSIRSDSRQVEPGDLFVAVVGRDADGHRFVPQAVANGASALVLEREVPGLAVPYVVVDNSRRSLALMAAAYNGNPGRRLRVIGITGTDGKTTTSTLAASVLEAGGCSTGLLTTVAARIGQQTLDTGLHTTTPDPLDFHRYLALMADAGLAYAIVETTSHGLDQDRTLGAEYDVAVVTNVTHEHLDYHGTYQAYLEAKAKLFQWLSLNYRKPNVPKVAVLNVDDESYAHLRRFTADRTITYGIDNPADVRPIEISPSKSETRLRIMTPSGEVQTRSPLLGRYNVYNMLATVAIGVSQGVAPEAIGRGIGAVDGIVGRLERIDEGQDFTAVVDFAHTPNSLRRLLELARQMAERRVIVTFGCAGLRDRNKRPTMGEIAARHADAVVITSEDPRTEDPDEIMEAVAEGCRRAGGEEGRTFWRVADRGEAIRFAVGLAREGDIVITTGKGHEQSMCIGTVETPWSEHAALRQALRERLGKN